MPVVTNAENIKNKLISDIVDQCKAKALVSPNKRIPRNFLKTLLEEIQTVCPSICRKNIDSELRRRKRRKEQPPPKDPPTITPTPDDTTIASTISALTCDVSSGDHGEEQSVATTSSSNTTTTRTNKGGRSLGATMKRKRDLDTSIIAAPSTC